MAIRVKCNGGEQKFVLDSTVNARYVRIETTKLGKTAYDETATDAQGARDQLAEIEIYGDFSQQLPVEMGLITLSEVPQQIILAKTVSIQVTATPSIDNATTQTGQESTTTKENGAKTGDVASIAGMIVLALAGTLLLVSHKKK